MDPAGAVVPQATVVVRSEATGIKQQTRTNIDGSWSIPFLQPGKYDVSISASGFKTENQRGIELQAADNKQLDVSLQLGGAEQTVEVTAETPLIDTTSATSGTVITGEEIEDLPSQSHVATLFAALSPGVVEQFQNNNVVHLWSYQGSSQFTANGGRNNIYSNTFLLDGFPDVRIQGYISFNPPQESLSEFRVQTNAYDVTIERQSGSTINELTKSGTNRIHGELYEYNQNNRFNANYFQNNASGSAIPPVHFNEFGVTFGGPVWIPKIYNGKNRSFFFVSWDYTYNIDPRGGLRSVPTARERQGDFSQSFTTQLQNNVRVRIPIQIYDPTTVNRSTGTRQLFSYSGVSNVIPPSRLNPIALRILSYVPLPNQPSDGTSNTSNDFASPATRRDTYPVISIRGDQNWSERQRSFGVLRWAHLHESLGNDFNTVATGNQMQRVPEQVGLDHVWVLTSNRILDLRFCINRFLESNNDNGAGFDLTQLGFSPTLVSQLVKPSFPRIVGIAGDFGSAQGGSYANNTYDTWSSGVTEVYRKHSFRYGGDYWVLQEAYGNIGAQPQFNFDSTIWTRRNNTAGAGTGEGSNFAQFLLGLPNNGNVPVNATGFYSEHFMGLYFQDDWRVNSKLTLNLGLRWDYETPATERYNRLTSNFDLSTINPISPAAQTAYAQILANPANNRNSGVQALRQILPASSFKVPGVQRFAGMDGQTQGTFNPDYHEWQPRLGLAYRLGPNTVIRGGFGRFTQPSFERGGQNGFSRTTPFIATTNNNLDPYDTLSNPFHSGVLAPTGSSLGALTNLGQGVDWVNQYAGRFYSIEYSLHLQHQIHRWLFEIGYSHNKTFNIYWPFDQNLQPFPLWQQLRQPQFDAHGRPLDLLQWDVQVPNPFNGLPGISASIGSSSTVALNQLLRPDPLLSGITENDNAWGKNQYDALQAKVEHRLSSGFELKSAFTWSKLFEDTSFWGPEIAGRVAEHKLGGEDRPFVLAIAPVWHIPFGRGKKWGNSVPKFVDLALGGWELSGTYKAQSGLAIPFTVDSFFSGKDFSLPNDQRTLQRWFDTSQFIRFPDKNTDISNYPAWTGIQDLPGYNYKPSPSDSIKNGVYQDFATFVRRYPTRWSDVRGPGVNNFDIGVLKNFALAERIRMQLKASAFNALNHPRFGSPNSDPTSAQFGMIAPTQLNNPRLIEFAGKITF